jgi:hypothetical protein
MRKLLIIIPLAFAGVAAGVVAGDRVLRAVRPVTVPAVLAGEVALAEAAGFRLCSWHKFGCAETDVHVHMTTPDGRVQVTIGETMLEKARSRG